MSATQWVAFLEHAFDFTIDNEDLTAKTSAALTALIAGQRAA